MMFSKNENTRDVAFVRKNIKKKGEEIDSKGRSTFIIGMICGANHHQAVDHGLIS